jgi:hypothetical protein
LYHFKILGARRFTCSKFHTKGPVNITHHCTKLAALATILQDMFIPAVIPYLLMGCVPKIATKGNIAEIAEFLQVPAKNGYVTV